MFQSARIKLTLWFLLIIMVISSVFSLGIYNSFCRELERGFHRAEMRFQKPPGWINSNPDLIDDLKQAKQNFVLRLLEVNGLIFLVSSLTGYLLAGKALAPIEIALEDQKRFTADASHELRTPLTSLKTSIEVALKAPKLTLKQAKKILNSNLEDIDSLTSLTDNLLSLTQQQPNHQALVFTSVKVDQLIKSACKKVIPLAKKKHINLKIKTSKQMVKGHIQSLEGMLLIFLDNAVKYTPKGGQINLDVKSDKKNLVIKIKDTGIGIPQSDLPYIFDRFYRVDQSRSKTNIPGFGLGLALAKKIINHHHGSVNVSSSLNKGTIFTIKLPLKSS